MGLLRKGLSWGRDILRGKGDYENERKSRMECKAIC